MDTQARLPLAVRKKVHRAREIERQIKQGIVDAESATQDRPHTEAPDANGDGVAGGANGANGASRSDGPEGSGENGAAPKQQSVQQGTDSQQQPVSSHATAQAVASQTQDSRENDPAYWKQRFSSTMGILRREREDRIAESKRLTERIASLEAELAKAKEAAASSTIDLSEYLTAEQIEELGEQKATEMVLLARKVAESEVKRRVEAALAPIQERQRHEQSIRQRELLQRFHDDLTDAVPSWQEINRGEDWLAWLGGHDERTGLVRQEIIDMAQERLDAKPIIALLKEFLAYSGVSLPQHGAKTVSPKASAAAGRAESQEASQDAVRPMTPQEIRRRYTEIATNKRLTEKERMKQLAELEESYRRLMART